MSPEKIPLSVAIITKNEEERLPACLESVAFADDIVVLDSGSTDRTVPVAGSFGCRVFVEEWKGYGPQKNSAVEKCRNEWVLLLDADERAGKGLGEIISRALQSQDADAFRLRRKNFLHGRWMRHSGYWPDLQTRLVRKGRGSFEAMIHEKWITDGRVKDLDADIEHFAFSSYADMLKTLDDYSTLIARELFVSGRKATPFSALYHGLGMFLKIYFMERGFLDGLDGLVTALTKAGGSFFKYAKLIELQRERKK
ncbi:MAG: glycosyltransferase family 2 protein [Nitrospirae bacterium]|nr:glycosyltransferase family 2 protein [Nitrospirota bacterium]